MPSIFSYICVVYLLFGNVFLGIVHSKSFNLKINDSPGKLEAKRLMDNFLSSPNVPQNFCGEALLYVVENYCENIKKTGVYLSEKTKRSITFGDEINSKANFFFLK